MLSHSRSFSIVRDFSTVAFSTISCLSRSYANLPFPRPSFPPIRRLMSTIPLAQNPLKTGAGPLSFFAPMATIPSAQFLCHAHPRSLSLSHLNYRLLHPHYRLLPPHYRLFHSRCHLFHPHCCISTLIPIFLLPLLPSFPLSFPSFSPLWPLSLSLRNRSNFRFPFASGFYNRTTDNPLPFHNYFYIKYCKKSNFKL